MYGKRLTLPEKWATPRFRKLHPNVKVLLYYILDTCDWGGFLEIDTEAMHFYTQISENEIPQLLEELSQEEILINNGWLFVKDFIESQGNSPLNPSNNAHKNIIAKLNDNIIHFQECLRTQKNLAPYEEHIRDSSKSNSKGICMGKGNSISNGNDESKVLRIESNDSKSNKENKPIGNHNEGKSFDDSILLRTYTARGKDCETCNASFGQPCGVITAECTAGDQIKMEW